jgi:hypothetical protein
MVGPARLRLRLIAGYSARAGFLNKLKSTVYKNGDENYLNNRNYSILFSPDQTKCPQRQSPLNPPHRSMS